MEIKNRFKSFDWLFVHSKIIQQNDFFMCVNEQKGLEMRASLSSRDASIVTNVGQWLLDRLRLNINPLALRCVNLHGRASSTIKTFPKAFQIYYQRVFHLHITTKERKDFQRYFMIVKHKKEKKVLQFFFVAVLFLSIQPQMRETGFVWYLVEPFMVEHKVYASQHRSFILSSPKSPGDFTRRDLNWIVEEMTNF